MGFFSKKKSKKNEIKYGDMRDFLEREYDEDGNEIPLTKEDGDYSIHITMIYGNNEELRQKGLLGIRKNAEKGHIDSCVYMWSHSKDKEEAKKWDDIVGFSFEYLQKKASLVDSMKN